MSAFWRMFQTPPDWERDAAMCDSMLSYTCKMLRE
jgi:hypothetical protein